MQTKQEVLKACTVSGNIVTLPQQLDRKLYQEVAKALELIGGKWNRKVSGFLFPQDPTSLLGQVANGTKRNLKKEYQFFPTPQPLAQQMVELADIQPDDIVLEPSAGQGAIIKEIQRQHPGRRVNYWELMPINRNFLSDIPNTFFCGSNFLGAMDQLYTKIIANPPFSQNQDIKHIIQMYLVLKPGGRIVTIASKHWQIGNEGICQQFREWLDEIGAVIDEVEAGQFSESGTEIPTVLITIDK